MVRSALATSTKLRSDLMRASVQSVWVQLDIQGTLGPCDTREPPGTQVLIGGLYREWTDLVLEMTALSKVREQWQAASAETDNVIFAGDVNLNTARRFDMRYRGRCLMLAHNTLRLRRPTCGTWRRASRTGPTSVMYRKTAKPGSTSPSSTTCVCPTTLWPPSTSSTTASRTVTRCSRP
jgi:hypothetical protein